MDSWLIFSLVLFAVGLLFAAVEVIVPSGGLLGLVALGCIVGSLASAYQVSGATAVTMAVIEVICVPTVVVFVFKYLPKTTVGKQLILSPPEHEADAGAGSFSSAASALSSYADLLGKEGIVVASLRPSGTVEIDGRRVSVVSEGEVIDSGRHVKVVLIEGNRVVVEATDA